MMGFKGRGGGTGVYIHLLTRFKDAKKKGPFINHPRTRFVSRSHKSPFALPYLRGLILHVYASVTFSITSPHLPAPTPDNPSRLGGQSVSGMKRADRLIKV